MLSLKETFIKTLRKAHLISPLEGSYDDYINAVDRNDVNAGRIVPAPAEDRSIGNFLKTALTYAFYRAGIIKPLEVSYQEYENAADRKHPDRVRMIAPLKPE